MKRHFYHHLITIDSIHAALDDLDLSVEERKELIDIAESGIHHLIIDTILTELSEEDKKIFLNHMADEAHDELWNHIKRKIDKTEEKIKMAVNCLLADLHKDIAKAKE
ncbi:MAG: hypothetical protein O3B87_01620 [bacterium]|nr:hypothetical protein [bacterium]